MKNYKNNVGARLRPCPNNRGITLIALVITIIVMLILVAVTISMAINGGLFQKAGEATGDTQNKIDEEQTLASGRVQIDGKWYASIDDYLAGKEEVVPNPNETFSEIYDKNTTITQGSYTAVVPKGFAVGISDGINRIEDGLVITDAVNSEGKSIGNEFVWIPVEVTETDTETSIASFYRSDWLNNERSTSYKNSTTYVETVNSEMLKSVYQNKGFYIGRYETGMGISDDSSFVPVVKRDVIPVNNMYGPALNTLASSFYQEDDVGAVSTLCYGIQWDSMLDFIKSGGYDVTSSSDWGNCKGKEWTITRTSAKYTSSPSSDTTWSLIDDEEGDSLTKDSTTSILLTTGASDEFCAKHIYDVVGNVQEYTFEKYNFYPRSAGTFLVFNIV